MAVELKTFDELYDVGQTELQTLAPQVTDYEEGSIADAFLGIAATLAEEVQVVMVDRFNNTFTELAEGDDLETLLTDHFGDEFARPGAVVSSGIVEFSRPTADAGAVTIPAGTIVSTEPDASGNTQKYETLLEVNLGALDLTVNASVEAQEAGAAGNVVAGTITVIDSSLTDPTITVSNPAATTGGADELDDAEYREFARNKIESIRGGTCSAIESTALTVSGVEFAKAVEVEQSVIEWDIPTGTPVGDPFFIPRTTLYIADANGSADQTLIDAVKDAILPIRSCGVRVNVVSGVGVSISWDATITLNTLGPNYADLSVDSSPIRQTMQEYITNLPVGSDFIRADAEAYVLSVWGPSGTDDLSAIDTNVPTGEVDAEPTEKLLASFIDVTTS